MLNNEQIQAEETAIHEAKVALLAQIKDRVPRSTAGEALALAEAYAWVVAPNQAH